MPEAAYFSGILNGMGGQSLPKEQDFVMEGETPNARVRVQFHYNTALEEDSIRIFVKGTHGAFDGLLGVLYASRGMLRWVPADGVE